MTKQGLVLLLAVCMIAAAIPRERRAINTEEEEVVVDTGSDPLKPICQKKTPCAWHMYNANGIVNEQIINSYCKCNQPDTTCQMIEDDTNSRSYVFYCRLPPTTTDLPSDS